MPPNPYALADRRQRAARRRVDGWAARAGALGPLVGAAIAVPLVRDTVYGFLDGPAAGWVEGATGVAARLGLAVAAGLALASYNEVIRGPDRGVVDLHPLLPEPWLRARLASLGRTRASWLLVAGVLLVPLAGSPLAAGLAAGVIGGAWLAGVGAGLGVNLAAPRVAADPRWAGLLDAVRGPNPRLQAALLYAPGVALAIAGVATLAAAHGMGLVLGGHEAGLLWLAAPPVVGLLGLWAAFRNAVAMDRLPSLLGEIDAAWASVEVVEEGRLVYLEWLVRFAPAGLRRDLLRELRHLWRGMRPWVTGSWGLAFLAGLAGWTSEPAGAARLAMVGGAALLVLGFAGVRLAATDPAWLDAMLPAPRRPFARTLALWAVMQPVVIVGVAALLVRQGVLALGVGLRLEIVAGLLAAGAAASGERWRGRAGLLYVPAGMVVWALGGVA